MGPTLAFTRAKTGGFLICVWLVALSCTYRLTKLLYFMIHSSEGNVKSKSTGAPKIGG
jgi:hypothetical protein